MHGSDEEIDDQPEVGSDEDFSDDGDKHALEEVDFCFHVLTHLPICICYEIFPTVSSLLG